MRDDDSYSMYQELIEAALEEPDGQILGELFPFNKRHFPLDDESESIITTGSLKKKLNITEALNDSTDVVGGEPGVEEGIIFKRKKKARRIKKYTATEMKAIEEMCKTTIVHDYGRSDWYHLSEEHKAKHDRLGEIRDKIAPLKSIYNNPADYIIAMRVVMEALTILASKNYVHTTEEFFQLVGEGRIRTSNIPIPKLKRVKQYNLDLIISYISNLELNPEDLRPAVIEEQNNDQWYFMTEEEKLAMAQKLFSAEETEYIINHAENPEELAIGGVKAKDIKGYDNRSLGWKKKTKKKKKRKDRKGKDLFRESLHVMLNKIQSGISTSKTGYSYMVTTSIFDPGEPVKSVFDDVHFNGSWTDKHAVALYDLIMDEKLLGEPLPTKRGVTHADAARKDFWNIMEANGMNVQYLRQKMNMTDTTENKKTAKREKKDNRKKEAELFQRVTKLNKDKGFKKIVSKAEDALSDIRKKETDFNKK